MRSIAIFIAVVSSVAISLLTGHESLAGWLLLGLAVYYAAIGAAGMFREMVGF